MKKNGDRAVLGVMLDGNLDNCAIGIGMSPLGRGYAFGLTFDQFNKHIIVIGGTGTGKTITQLRIMSSLMALSNATPNEPRIRIIFIDAKGADANSPFEKLSMQEKVVSLATRHNFEKVFCFPNRFIDLDPILFLFN